MARKNIVENVLLKKHLTILIENMYWNKRNDAILVYVMEHTNFEAIEPQLLVDTLLKMDGYKNDFWFMSPAFDTLLIKKLINNGFVILSGRNYINKYNKKWSWDDKFFKRKYVQSRNMMFGILYSKYPILYLDNVHEPKTAVRLLNKYELKVDVDFDKIIEKCAIIHGESWLSKKLRSCYKKLYAEYNETDSRFKFISFALYRNNELKAGEFGCIIGKMYISYSGYYEESSAGTVQMIKMFRFLKNADFVCCNLFGIGETYKYKYRFGTVDIELKDYIKLFNELTK